MSTTAGGNASSSPPRQQQPAAAAVRLATIGWKRRSGFGNISGKVGVGNSWERRKIVLIGTRLSYYAVVEGEGEEKQQGTARGTLDVRSDRLTVYPSVHRSDMPTPFGLTLRGTSQSLPGEDLTRWNLCFDTRRQQAAFLLAIADVVVTNAVTDFNAAVLETEGADSWWVGHSHGGFHRLYEEDGQEVFGIVKASLLAPQEGEAPPAAAADGASSGAGATGPPENMAMERGSSKEVNAKLEQTDDVGEGSSSGIDNDGGAARVTSGDNPRREGQEESVDLAAAAPPLSSDQRSRDQAEAAGDRRQKDDTPTMPDGSFVVPPNNLRSAFAVVNFAVVYTFLGAGASSTLVLSWWQVLLLMNFGFWTLLVRPPLPSSSKGEEIMGEMRSKGKDEALLEEKEERKKPKQKEQEEAATDAAALDATSSSAMQPELPPRPPRSQAPTASVVGAALLREMDVPLSEVPSTDSGIAVKPTPPRADTTSSRLKPEPTLSEFDMDFHAHERWAVSDPQIDLSGSWVLIADDAFKAEYDTYLRTLGFNRLTRGVAVSLIARTTEVTKQSDRGRKLYLCGKNPKGSWERTVVSSGYPDFETQSHRAEGKDYFHRSISIKTAESEDVDAEAWWEDRGTVHRSWLRGGTKYGGGDFESRRYLQVGGEGGSDGGGDVLVCESVFHPSGNGAKAKAKAKVTWRFRRVENE